MVLPSLHLKATCSEISEVTYTHAPAPRLAVHLVHHSHSHNARIRGGLLVLGTQHQADKGGKVSCVGNCDNV